MADELAALRARLLDMADEWDAQADDAEEHGRGSVARAVRADARDLRALLADAAPEGGGDRD